MKTTIYETLKSAGVPLDSHESDLYVKVTPASRAIVTIAIKRGDISSAVRTFRSDVDGAQWYEIPFAYDPFWTAKAAAASTTDTAVQS